MLKELMLRKLAKRSTREARWRMESLIYDVLDKRDYVTVADLPKVLSHLYGDIGNLSLLEVEATLDVTLKRLDAVSGHFYETSWNRKKYHELLEELSDLRYYIRELYATRETRCQRGKPPMTT